MRRALPIALSAIALLACNRTFDIPFGIPASPPRIRAQAVIRGAVVDWQLVPGATRYDLCASTAPDPDVSTCVNTPTSVKAVDVVPPHRISLDPSLTWFVRVRASSPAGPAATDDSTASASVRVRPIPDGQAGLLPATELGSIQGSPDAMSLGFSVAIGDFDGDGFSEIAVGAPDPISGPGTVEVEPLKDAPVSSPVKLTGPGINARFGYSVATADVDGDGYDDLLVGAPFALDAGTQVGKAFLYKGGPQGLSTTPAFTATGDPQEEMFGFAVAFADVDGDGHPDLVVGAPHHSETGLFDAGEIALYPAPGGVPATISTRRLGSAANDEFGSAVADAGDVDRDGKHDLIVGAPRHTNTLNGEGAAYLFLGGSPLAATAAWTTFGAQATAGWGNAVGGGDVNGDGISDLVVGAPAFDGTFADGGRVTWYRGFSGSLPPTSPSWTADGASAGAAFGLALAVGDVNGDGFADTAIGAPADATLGKVSLFLGSQSGPPITSSNDDIGASNSNLGGAIAIGALDAGASMLAEGAPNEAGAVGSVALHVGPPGAGPFVDAGEPVRSRVLVAITLKDPVVTVESPANGLSCTLDWGDGTGQVTIPGCLDVAGHTHTYATAGRFAARLTASIASATPTTSPYLILGQGETDVTITAP